VVLRTEDGVDHTIGGKTVAATCFVMGPGIEDWAAMAGDDTPNFALQQSIVRYTWDGEVANGMMERSRVAGGS
jgi:hypothetical protein